MSTLQNTQLGTPVEEQQRIGSRTQESLSRKRHVKSNLCIVAYRAEKHGGVHSGTMWAYVQWVSFPCLFGRMKSIFFIVYMPFVSPSPHVRDHVHHIMTMLHCRVTTLLYVLSLGSMRYDKGVPTMRCASRVEGPEIARGPWSPYITLTKQVDGQVVAHALGCQQCTSLTKQIEGPQSAPNPWSPEMHQADQVG